MGDRPTIGHLANLLEKWFVNDESLSEGKRELAGEIVEELRGLAMNKRYNPEHDYMDDVAERRKFEEFEASRNGLKKFKPMPLADVHIARCCANCAFNKGFPIQDGNEFLEYGRAFYYGFYPCTLNGREADKCMVTDTFGVCKHHKFREEMKGFTKGKPRPLAHLEKCIRAREAKEET